MSEIGESVGLRKQTWRQPSAGEFVRSIELKVVRNAVGLVLLLAVLAMGVECISSYVLYRHFANLNRSFYPTGSATLALSRYVIAKAEGRHGDETIVSIGHGSLFRTDKILGYSMYPGKYRVTEKHYGQSHAFDLTVDEFGRRITSATGSTSSRRLFLAGDSAIFGWGLNDEQTLPWMLQKRFPKFDVVNLSLTSYSTIHALLLLEHANPKVSADDVVVINYHPITNGFNVASDEMLSFLRTGFERQLGDSDVVQNMFIPIGVIDKNGQLAIEHYSVGACAKAGASPAMCPSRQLSIDEENQVTERAFDAILAAQPGHVIIAWLSGADSDPVVHHLKEKGVFIADLRMEKTEPDATDVMFIDAHSGPFWHRTVAEHLGDVLQHAGVLE
jgi:hypothetical protein